MKLGGDELIRVVVRQANFDKIAHKIDRMGDYKPEIVYENAEIQEIDPRDDAALARINESSTPKFVTVRDEINLPVIAAFPFTGSEVAGAPPNFIEGRLEEKVGGTSASRRSRH